MCTFGCGDWKRVITASTVKYFFPHLGTISTNGGKTSRIKQLPERNYLRQRIMYDSSRKLIEFLPKSFEADRTITCVKELCMIRPKKS